MIIRLIVIFTSFFFLFAQEKNDSVKKKKKIFSNSESTEEYLDLLEKSLGLLRTNYVDSVNESEIISNGSNINIVRSNDGYVRVVSAK